MEDYPHHHNDQESRKFSTPTSHHIGNYPKSCTTLSKCGEPQSLERTRNWILPPYRRCPKLEQRRRRLAAWLLLPTTIMPFAGVAKGGDISRPPRCALSSAPEGTGASLTHAPGRAPIPGPRLSRPFSKMRPPYLFLPIHITSRIRGSWLRTTLQQPHMIPVQSPFLFHRSALIQLL